MRNYFFDVVEFQRKFGLQQSYTPTLSTPEYCQHRKNFLREEVREFEEAIENGDLAKAADALVDIVYVAMGTADGMGLPFNPLWDDVHRANMSKERGVSHRGYGVDVIKPEGWEGPKTEEILVLNGWIHPDYSLKVEAGCLEHILRAGVFISSNESYPVGGVIRIYEAQSDLAVQLVRITGKGKYPEDSDGKPLYYYSVFAIPKTVPHHPV